MGCRFFRRRCARSRASCAHAPLLWCVARRMCTVRLRPASPLFVGAAPALALACPALVCP
eukprot:5246819-Pleurochrysis_carterae.AAC.1